MALFDTNSGLGGLLGDFSDYGFGVPKNTGLVADPEREAINKRALLSGLISAGLTYAATPKNLNTGSAIPYLGKAGLAGFNTSQNTVDQALNAAYRNKLVAGRDDIFSNINPLDVTQESLKAYQDSVAQGKPDRSLLRKAAPVEKLPVTRTIKRGRQEVFQELQSDGSYKDYAISSLDPPREPKEIDTFKQTNELRNTFQNLPEVKSWNITQPILVSAREAAKDTSGASDLNLIYALGKALDPNSVVREGELALAAGTGSLGEKLKGYYKSTAVGGKLTPEVKQDLLRQIESRTYAQKKQYESAKTQYTSIANKYKLDPSELFIEPIVEPLDTSVDRTVNTISTKPQVQNINQGFNLNTPIKSQPKALSDEELKLKYKR